jgi:MFS family permease
MVVGVIGPLLAGYMVDQRGFKTMMLVAFILYACASALRIWMTTTRRFESRQRSEKPSLSSLRSRLGGILALLASGGIVTWILITDGISDVAAQLSNELQPIYVSQIGGLSMTQIGSLNSILSLTMMVIMILAGWLSDHIGERIAIAAGFFLQFIGLIVFVSVSRYPGFILVALILGASFGTIIPAYDSLVSKSVPENMRGVAFGFFRTSLGLISLPAPWIGAQLWEKFSPQTPFLVTAAATLSGVFLAWFKFRQPRAAPATISGETTLETGDEGAVGEVQPPAH